MSTELRELHSRIERIRKILHQAIKAHSILNAFAEFVSSELHDRDEVREHKMLLKAYDTFFDPVSHSLLLDIHIQLAKILIDNEDSLQLKKLIRYVRSEDRKIRKAKDAPGFKESIDDFGVWYTSLTVQDLEEIKTQLVVYDWLISKLELVRNKSLAHEDVKVVPAELLSLDELAKLIALSESILNKIAHTYGGRDWDRYKLNDINRDTTFMLERLYSTY